MSQFLTIDDFKVKYPVRNPMWAEIDRHGYDVIGAYACDVSAIMQAHFKCPDCDRAVTLVNDPRCDRVYCTGKCGWHTDDPAFLKADSIPLDPWNRPLQQLSPVKGKAGNVDYWESYTTVAGLKVRLVVANK